MIRKGIRLVSFAIILFMAYQLFELYFTKVFPIGERLQGAVDTAVAEHGGIYVSNDKIPQTFRDAVIATEDVRFETDPGIDPVGILRSLVEDVKHRAWVQGGSTITQQLVRNAFLNQDPSLTRKMEEMAMAFAVYQHVSKDRTFELYANEVYFGHGAYGIGQAARVYFNTTADQLTAPQCVLLAGLPNAPSDYDPYKSMALARSRERWVLDRMVAANDLSASEADRIYGIPIQLAHHS